MSVPLLDLLVEAMVAQLICLGWIWTAALVLMAVLRMAKVWIRPLTV